MFMLTPKQESVDIASYVDKAIVTRRRAEQAGIQLLEPQLPIFGITKEASLAIRYQLSDGQVSNIALLFLPVLNAPVVGSPSATSLSKHSRMPAIVCCISTPRHAVPGAETTYGAFGHRSTDNRLLASSSSDCTGEFSVLWI